MEKGKEQRTFSDTGSFTCFWQKTQIPKVEESLQEIVIPPLPSLFLLHGTPTPKKALAAITYLLSLCVYIHGKVILAEEEEEY